MSTVLLLDGPHKGRHVLRLPGAVLFVANADDTVDVYELTGTGAKTYAHAGRRRLGWLIHAW